jgi:hypothetical protein
MMGITRFINEYAGHETIVYKHADSMELLALLTAGWSPTTIKRAGVADYIQKVRDVLYVVARWINTPVIVELGTRDGYSTSAFAAALNKCGSGCLYSFDPVWDEKRFHLDLMEPCEWFYHELTGEQGYEQFGKAIQSIDLLYIDTDPHEYQQTKMWLHDYWIHNVRPGGYIMLDDCSPYFQQGVDRSKVPGFVGDFQLINAGEWGVLQAILEFVEEQNDKIEFAFSVFNHSSPGTAIIKLKEGYRI